MSHGRQATSAAREQRIEGNQGGNDEVVRHEAERQALPPSSMQDSASGRRLERAFGCAVGHRLWVQAHRRSPQAVIHLRRATNADAPAVAQVFLNSFDATYDFPLAHSDDEVRDWIRDRLIPTQETWVAVDDALDGAPVIGLMAITPGHLEHLYVAPNRLGEGLGRRFVDLAKERFPGGLTLWTFQVNDRARRFYERNGFVPVEFTDGDNQERQPDVRYEWSPS